MKVIKYHIDSEVYELDTGHRAHRHNDGLVVYSKCCKLKPDGKGYKKVVDAVINFIKEEKK